MKNRHPRRGLTVIPPQPSIDEVPSVNSNDDQRSGEAEKDHHQHDGYVSSRWGVDEIGADAGRWFERRRQIGIRGHGCHEAEDILNRSFK